MYNCLSTDVEVMSHIKELSSVGMLDWVELELLSHLKICQQWQAFLAVKPLSSKKVGCSVLYFYCIFTAYDFLNSVGAILRHV
jgi:hypothetical protein